MRFVLSQDLNRVQEICFGLTKDCMQTGLRSLVIKQKAGRAACSSCAEINLSRSHHCCT